MVRACCFVCTPRLIAIMSKAEGPRPLYHSLRTPTQIVFNIAVRMACCSRRNNNKRRKQKKILKKGWRGWEGARKINRCCFLLFLDVIFIFIFIRIWRAGRWRGAPWHFKTTFASSLTGADEQGVALLFKERRKKKSIIYSDLIKSTSRPAWVECYESQFPD